MFYGRGRIKRNHRHQMFYGGRRIRMRSLKYKTHEADYEEYSNTVEVLRYFNIFGCGRNLLNRLDVTYERAYITTQEEE